MPDRKYGQDEIQQILKKAAEKQQKAHEVTRPVIGLSIEEIERIAAEAGIDPRFVREAAWESKTLDDQRTYSKLFGGMTSMRVKHSLPVLIPENELDTELVPVIRHHAGKQGQFEKLGKSLTWFDGDSASASYTEVQVSSKDGRTDIEVGTTKNVKQIAFVIFLFPLILFFLLMAGVAKNGMDAVGLVFVMMILLTAAGARFGYARWASGLEQKLRTITNALEDKILESSGDISSEQTEIENLPEPQQQSSGLLDIDDLEDSGHAPETSSTKPRDRTS